MLGVNMGGLLLQGLCSFCPAPLLVRLAHGCLQPVHSSWVLHNGLGK